MSVAFAPLAESIVFLGWLQSALEKYCSAWWALFLAGLAFLAIHFSVSAPLAAAVRVLCFIRMRTRSLGAVVIAHAAINLSMYAIEPRLGLCRPVGSRTRRAVQVNSGQDGDHRRFRARLVASASLRQSAVDLAPSVLQVWQQLRDHACGAHPRRVRADIKRRHDPALTIGQRHRDRT